MQPEPFAIALAVVCAAAFSPAQGREPAHRPNVVLVLADDLGWTDLGHAGSDLHETPHLDRLAGESMLFTNAYAAAPVCTRRARRS